MALTRLDLKIEFQMCRGLGHSWDIYEPGVGERKSAPWGQRLSLLCVRCGMTRHDTFDLLGDLSDRRYIQPTGYKMEREETPRIQQIRRSLAKALHDGDLQAASKASRRLRVAQGRTEASKVKRAVKRAPARKRTASRR